MKSDPVPRHVPQEDDFAPPPPPWGDERDGTHEARVEIGFAERGKWRDAPACLDAGSLTILGHPVMQDWETPYMKELARIAASRGGVVLELGFGMGISAGFIQQADIERHVVVEVNREVAERARAFARSAPRPVEVLEGFWEEVVDRVPDGTVDGILFDTYPLSELEIHKNHFGFFRTAFRKLKPGGVFTYYSDESTTYHPVHLQKLLDAGFRLENVGGKTVPVNPPPGCRYGTTPTLLAPIVTK